MEKEKSCGAVIFNDKNEVLIVKHLAGHWDFPKGHIEQDETEIETAIREVKEETNIDVEIYSTYKYESHYSPKKNIKKTVIFFLARNKTSKLIKQNEEIGDIGWYGYNDAMKILTYDTAKEILKKAYKDINMIKKK